MDAEASLPTLTLAPLPRLPHGPVGTISTGGPRTSEGLWKYSALLETPPQRGAVSRGPSVNTYAHGGRAAALGVALLEELLSGTLTGESTIFLGLW